MLLVLAPLEIIARSHFRKYYQLRKLFARDFGAAPFTGNFGVLV
jgi:hypothetical protein